MEYLFVFILFIISVYYIQNEIFKKFVLFSCSCEEVWKISCWSNCCFCMKMYVCTYIHTYRHTHIHTYIPCFSIVCPNLSNPSIYTSYHKTLFLMLANFFSQNFSINAPFKSQINLIHLYTTNRNWLYVVKSNIIFSCGYQSWRYKHVCGVW
jgi:hypothetical protein